MAEAADVHRHRFRPSEIGSPLKIDEQRQQDGPDRVDVDDGFSETRPSRRAVGSPELVRGPGVRGLVNRQRHDHDREPDQDRSERSKGRLLEESGKRQD